MRGYLSCFMSVKVEEMRRTWETKQQQVENVLWRKDLIAKLNYERSDETM